jgi:tektin-1
LYINNFTKILIDQFYIIQFFREQRLEIDLVNDIVEKELRQECKGIKCADRLMSKMLEEIQEQIRCIKAILYKIDSDLQNKENNLFIDRHNFTLNETSLNLSIYCGEMPLDTSYVDIIQIL